MEKEEWKSGMMVEDEQILGFISEIDKAIDKAKETFKDYRPLFNGDRWISDREAAEFLKISRHTFYVSAERVAAIRVALWQDTLPRTGFGGTFATKPCASAELNLPHEEKAADIPSRMFAAFLHCSITLWGNHP